MRAHIRNKRGRPVAVRVHGLSRTSEYRAWQTMRLRCTDPANQAWADYGGRGITVCDRWKDSPENFIADMGRKPTPKHEIDRIDNDGPYSPENCRWATRSENDRNRRSNRWVTASGERKTLAEWSQIVGISDDVLSKRLDAGWSPEIALYTPVAPKAPNGSRPKPVGACHCGRPATRPPFCGFHHPDEMARRAKHNRALNEARR